MTYFPKWNNDRVVYELNEKILRVGSDDDDVFEIEDNIEVWEDIIHQFDGKRSVEEIQEYILKKYSIEVEDSIEFIKKFHEKNFIEYFKEPYVEDDKYNLYFESALTYYSSAGFGGSAFLEKLKNMHIVVLGCGAGGSHIAYYLSQAGVGNIHLVDPDIVDLKNINRQALFKMSDVGKSKVETLKDSISEKNPYVNISTSMKKLKTIKDVELEIMNSDFVVCSMDEPPYVAQRIVNRACFNAHIKSAYCFSQKSAGKMFIVDPEVSACAD